MTPDFSRWREVVARYQAPSIPRSVIQLVNTLGPLAVTFVAMYFAMKVSYLLTLAWTASFATHALVSAWSA